MAALLVALIISVTGVGMRATAPEFVPLQSTTLTEPGAPQQQLHQQLPAPSADVSSEALTAQAFSNSALGLALQNFPTLC